MLEYVPVRFDLYRPLKPCLRWTLQCLVAFADRAGTCWPSVRKIAEIACLSKSTAARHLSSLTIAGVVTRKRRPGGGYLYSIDGRFLPASRGVSHSAKQTVPPARSEENPIKKNSDHDNSLKWKARQLLAKIVKAPHRDHPQHEGYQRKGGDDPRQQFQYDHGESSLWEARLRGWHKRRFWSNFWGPRPDQPGCWAPASAISAMMARAAATGSLENIMGRPTTI